MRQLFVRREAKVYIVNEAAKRLPLPPEERVRVGDLVWIIAAAAGGSLVLVPLGYLALRQRKPAE
jgi:hypothetical protein